MNTKENISVWQWLFTIIVQAIPIVGVILYFVWAFNLDDSRKNYCRAMLILQAILIAFGIVITIYNRLNILQIC